MRGILCAVLLICASAGWAWADAPGSTAKAPSDADTARQAEQEWTDALKAGDVHKVSQIIGDDWRAIWVDGSINTKASVLAGMKSGRYKVKSMQLSAVDVKIVGDVAIVQGIDTEQSTFDGRDSSGKYVWTDVLARHDGKWVAVRSQAAILKQ